MSKRESEEEETVRKKKENNIPIGREKRRDVQCCRVLSQYHLNIHSNSDTRDVHVQSMYMGLPTHTYIV